jgi:hypothetical protein
VPVHGTHSVDIHDSARDAGEQLGRRRIEAPERLLREQQRRAKASSVSPLALDAATDSVLLFLTGGVSLFGR